jgi:DNA-binding NarL/FixJ family response regulator
VSVEKLRVLVADDHELIRTFVVALLRDVFQVVAAVGDGEQLVEAALFSSPDVIVTDIAMPHIDGLQARKQLASTGIRIPFVFMTLLDMVALPSILPDEAVGYVHKLDLPDELALAVWAVVGGSSYFSKSFLKNQEDPEQLR